MKGEGAVVVMVEAVARLAELVAGHHFAVCSYWMSLHHNETIAKPSLGQSLFLRASVVQEVEEGVFLSLKVERGDGPVLPGAAGP